MKKKSYQSKTPTILIILGSIILIVSFPIYRMQRSLLQGGITTQSLTIEGILPNSPASDTALKKGDKVTSINGIKVNDASSFISHESISTKNIVTVDENGQSNNVEIMPNANQLNGKLGVILSDYGIMKKPVYMLLPQVLIDSYSGWEEKPLLLLHSTLYKDETYFRLKLLLIGIGALLIGLFLQRRDIQR